MSNDKLNTNNRNASRKTPEYVIAERLREAEISDRRRFVDLVEGTKRSYRDHTKPKTRFGPESIDGNYGVYCGNGLVIVDYDPYEIDYVPDAVDSFPDTLTIETPHGGRHYYFATDSDVSASGFDGGSIRTEGQYVVGPGSVLDECDKQNHKCSQLGEGHYTIIHDRPIQSVSATALPESKVETPEQDLGGSLANPDSVVEDIHDVDAPFDRLEIRLETFLDDRRRRALWEGRFSDAGYDDRSDAEMELVAHLGWFFGGNSDVVAQLMSLAAHRHPRTDWGEYRKWLTDARDSYRQTTISKMPDYDSTYDPPDSTAGYRPVVSSITNEKVMIALFAEYPATCREITNYELVDRSERHVNRALKQLIESGVAKRSKDCSRPNNPYVYYPAHREPD